MTVHQARKLQRNDPVSVVDGARRAIGVVLAKPRMGKGHRTWVTVAVQGSIVILRSCGSKMDRLLAPDRTIVLEFLPNRRRTPKQIVLYRGNPLDF